MRAAALVAIATVMTAGAAPVTPCAGAPKPGITEFSVEITSTSLRDSLVHGVVCLSSENNVGSFMATLRYDSTRARLVDVRVSSGMGSTNGGGPGLIRIAAVAPNGFARGIVASMSFKVAESGSVGRIHLAITEVTTSTGASLPGEVRTTSWPPNQPARRQPVVDSIRPRSAEVEHERVTDLTVYGRNFAATGNTIDFGGVQIGDLSSERGGTVIRFAAPTHLPVRGSAEMRRVRPGRVDVRVKHDGGTSNAVVFTVRGGQ